MDPALDVYVREPIMDPLARYWRMKFSFVYYKKRKFKTRKTINPTLRATIAVCVQLPSPYCGGGPTWVVPHTAWCRTNFIHRAGRGIIHDIEYTTKDRASGRLGSGWSLTTYRRYASSVVDLSSGDAWSKGFGWRV